MFVFTCAADLAAKEDEGQAVNADNDTHRQQPPNTEARLRACLSLPYVVQRVLCAAVSHLEGFHLDSVIRPVGTNVTNTHAHEAARGGGEEDESGGEGPQSKVGICVRVMCV